MRTVLLDIGGTLAKYAGERVETYLVTATRGDRGRFGESGGAARLNLAATE